MINQLQPFEYKNLKVLNMSVNKGITVIHLLNCLYLSVCLYSKMSDTQNAENKWNIEKSRVITKTTTTTTTENGKR